MYIIHWCETYYERFFLLNRIRSKQKISLENRTWWKSKPARFTFLFLFFHIVIEAGPALLLPLPSSPHYILLSIAKIYHTKVFMILRKLIVATEAKFGKCYPLFHCLCMRTCTNRRSELRGLTEYSIFNYIP